MYDEHLARDLAAQEDRRFWRRAILFWLGAFLAGFAGSVAGIFTLGWVL